MNPSRIPIALRRRAPVPFTGPAYGFSAEYLRSGSGFGKVGSESIGEIGECKRTIHSLIPSAEAPLMEFLKSAYGPKRI